MNIRTQGLERMRCSMIWDGMPCAKGLVARGMGRNALCEGTYCPCEGTGCPVWRDLVRYFVVVFEKGWDVRWYGTECPNGIGCSMIWDGMPCAKGLVARNMKRNALCEGTYCPCEGIECPMWRDLVRYFVIVFEKGWDVRWYETKCPNEIECPMIWDGMPCAKGLVARWYKTKCPMRRDLWPDDMGRNALCEGTWFDIFYIWIAITQFVGSYEPKKTGCRNVIMIYFRLLLIRYSYMRSARINVILLSP